MQCEKNVKTDRDIMFSEIEKQCPNFHMLSEEDKFIYMLSASGTSISIVAQFVHKHLTLKVDGPPSALTDLCISYTVYAR